MTPASIIPVFGSQRPYADLNFAGGSFGLDGRSVSDLTALPGFTFTRASLAMGYDATGKLTYGPNNLFVRSETFDNASWGKTNTTVSADAVVAPDGTTTADAVVLGAGTLAKYVSQSVTGPLGASSVLVVSVYAKAGTQGFLQLVNAGSPNYYANFDLSGGTVGNVGANTTATITSAGNGWYRCSAYLNGGVSYNTSNRFYAVDSGTAAYGATTAATGTFYLWGAQLEAVTYQTTPSTYYPTTTAAYYGPRLVYDPVTLASQGILVEEARTNSLVQSQDFSTTWATNRATVSVNATTSPDGTSNADKLIEDATASNTHRVVGAATTTAVPWTFSVYAKADTRSWIYLRLDRSTGGTPHAWFNIGAGTVGTAEPGWTSSIQNVGNGWYRCIATIDAALAAGGQPIIGLSTGDGVLNYNGDGTSGAFIWQAQLELGQGASSPIPTTTASVTRAAEDVTVTGLSVPDGCTVVFEANAPAFVSTDARMSLSDGTTSNRLSSNVSNTTLAAVQGTVAAGGLTGTSASVAARSLNKVAASTSRGAYRWSINGAAAVAETAGVMPTLTQLDIGKNAGSSVRYWNNTIKRIQVYKSVQPVASLTT